MRSKKNGHSHSGQLRCSSGLRGRDPPISGDPSMGSLLVAGGSNRKERNAEAVAVDIWGMQFPLMSSSSPFLPFSCHLFGSRTATAVAKGDRGGCEGARQGLLRN
ncbi:uncharacterized protein LOC122194789 [Lactuca sativa]|uniref:uncharacterized protein LOC122194789 n=1 Tax=Lactuca sativa TaxID=4236 RepID=UPI001C68BE9E|nr:uncharacterized protein LOC122194789 [Lactuca sativa]